MPFDAGRSLAEAARYRHPTPGIPGRLIEALVGCPHWTRLRRWLVARVPVLALASDVRDVAYLNWWVDASALPSPPDGYRYWMRDGRTPFTILSYRHGHFGPAMVGGLRRWFPSPLQSNWRWYLERVDAPVDAPETVLFACNVMDSAAHVVGARLWSDAMQPQLAAEFVHRWQGDALLTRIVAGTGNAPDLQCRLSRAGAARPPATGEAAQQSGHGWWQAGFASRDQALGFLVSQQAALAVAPDGRVALTRIDLPADLAGIVAMSLDVEGLDCPFVESIGGQVSDAWCFVLPNVPFRVVSEQLL